MFQSIIDFFNLTGVNIAWPGLIALLSMTWALVGGSDLEYKIKEVKNKNGEKEYKIFKYKK